MAAIVSMLRGVNLGKRRIKMDALRNLYESLGLQDPRTYVQSGNVVFGCKDRSLEKVAKRIEAAIEKQFGFQSDTILRTAAEMKDVVQRNPFAKRDDVHPGKLLVMFLDRDPGPEAGKKIAAITDVPEELYLDGRELYIYFPNGQARPTLKMTLVDKALNARWTGRNWNTVLALLEMAE